MRTIILSRVAAEKLIADGNFPGNAAVISFHEPDETDFVDYSAVTDRLIRVGIKDLSYDDLYDMNININNYFPEADDVAEFIINADNDGYNIVCQCEHGESRSAAAAAAIEEFFCYSGIDIFADYRYCPNQVIYNKLYEALCRHSDLSNRMTYQSCTLLGVGISPEDQKLLTEYKSEFEFIFTNEYKDIYNICSDVVLINPEFLDYDLKNYLRDIFHGPSDWEDNFLLTQYDMEDEEFTDFHIVTDLSEIFGTDKSLPW